MLNSCVVGKGCDPEELSLKLEVAGFDVTVVMLTTVVAESDPVFVFLSHMADVTMNIASYMATMTMPMHWLPEMYPHEPPSRR